MTRIYRYPGRAILVEVSQAGLGFAATGGILLLAEPAGAIAAVLAVTAALFLLYFARAVVRSLTRIELDLHGIRTRGPLDVAIPWEELRAMRLDHYTTRSDRSGGWMQLVVEGAKTRIRIDSGVTGFAQLAARVQAEASKRGRLPDERTRRNFLGLGIALHD